MEPLAKDVPLVADPISLSGSLRLGDALASQIYDARSRWSEVAARVRCDGVPVTSGV